MDFASFEHLEIVNRALFFANTYDFSVYAVDYNAVPGKLASGWPRHCASQLLPSGSPGLSSGKSQLPPHRIVSKSTTRTVRIRGSNLFASLQEKGPAEAAATARMLASASEGELEAFNTAYENAADAGLDAYKAVFGGADMSGVGDNIVDSTAKDMENNPAVKDAAQKMVEDARAEAVSTVESLDFTTIGKNMMDGIIQGVQDGTSHLVTAMVFLIIVVAITVEGLVEYLKCIVKAWQERTENRIQPVIIQMGAMAAAVFLCMVFKADVYGYLGITIPAQFWWLTCALTGIFASRGSNHVSDLIGRLRGMDSGTFQWLEKLVDKAAPLDDTRVYEPPGKGSAHGI